MLRHENVLEFTFDVAALSEPGSPSLASAPLARLLAGDDSWSEMTDLRVVIRDLTYLVEDLSVLQKPSSMRLGIARSSSRNAKSNPCYEEASF